MRSYGYVRIAANEDMIVICPWADNGDIIVEEFERIWEIVKAEYPVDESRIYASGFSKGASQTQQLAFAYPEVFAAIAPSPSFVGAQGTDEQWAALEEIGMPLVMIGGLFDFAFPLDSEGKIEATQNWMTVNGIEDQGMSISDALARSQMKDKAIARTGIPFETTYTEIHDGTQWYIGEYANDKYTDEEVCVFRIAAVENMPHWPSGYWAQFNWDFMKQWSRDLETGELVYTPAT